MARLNETPVEPKHVAPPTRGFSFSRNKRGIAGSLIWVNFDRHALLDLVWKLGGQFVANIDDVRLQFNTDQNVYLSQTRSSRARSSAAPQDNRPPAHLSPR